MILHDKLFHNEGNEAVEQTALRGCTVNTKLEQCKMNLKWYKGYYQHDLAIHLFRTTTGSRTVESVAY